MAGPQILGSDSYAVSIVNKGKRRHQQNKNGKNLYKIVSSTPLRGTLIKESEPGGNQYISAAGASLVQSAVAMRRYKCRMMIV